jgi:hydroxymethylpyrimidine pyrophosphatase-like HAD family hydrolase
MCQYLREKYGYTEYTGGHLEFHASGMVTFCLLGSGAKIEDKVVFDPDRSKRRVLYDEVCALFPEHVVYIGGSSSFDFAPKQYNKYDSIMRYAAEHGYALEDILFVGDDFDDGGGDSHVRIKGLDYIQIEDYTTLPERLAFL